MTTEQEAAQVAEPCDMDDCPEPSTRVVRTVLGPKPFCERHGRWVRMVEREWDEAEAEYLEQR